MSANKNCVWKRQTRTMFRKTVIADGAECGPIPIRKALRDEFSDRFGLAARQRKQPLRRGTSRTLFSYPLEMAPWTFLKTHYRRSEMKDLNDEGNLLAVPNDIREFVRVSSSNCPIAESRRRSRQKYDSGRIMGQLAVIDTVWNSSSSLATVQVS